MGDLEGVARVAGTDDQQLGGFKQQQRIHCGSEAEARNPGVPEPSSLRSLWGGGGAPPASPSSWGSRCSQAGGFIPPTPAASSRGLLVCLSLF